jgi:hypothetical protein
MGDVGDNLDVVRVEMVVGDGLRGGVKDGRDVVFGLNMGGDGGRRGEERFLDVALKDLAVGRRGEAGRGGHTWRRGEARG